MKIKATIEKVPGGMMVLPLLLGATIHTLAPKSAESLGGITGAVMTGTPVLLFVFFFAIGVNINLKASGKIAAKGINILIGKILLAAILGIGLNQILPENQMMTGVLSGLSVLAVIAAFNAANGGLYAALMSSLPDRDVDVAAYPFFSIQSGPFFTMITLGIAGIGSFPWQALVSTLVPFVLGWLLGTLDPEIREMFSPVSGALIPFFAFSIGFSMDFHMIINSGLTGILVGLGVVLISGFILSTTDKLILKSDGVAGWAASSTAGAAVSVPPLIAEMDKTFAPVATSATAIVATSVIVTAILTPVMTMWAYKRRYGEITK
ncbi:2-keto-3-deoxygluconate permease [Ligilactobacillus equi]|uniref:2-keto-3-deoxygluconate permease n=1 Tax=Ligilactobacillus equi TaxID=137357 RepID=UPI002ED01D98